MSIHPVTSDDAKKLQPLIDSVRSSLAVTHIRGLAEQRRERRRDIDLRDAAMRLGVAFAMHLPPGSPMPSDDFLLEHAQRILNGYDGTTRKPVKATR